MGSSGFLGEFEQLVLLAVVRLGQDAYGMRIRREIEHRAGRSTSIGAVYATLDRLEAKGFVRARDDSSGGRARRFFGVSPTGMDALESARELQARMWAGLRTRLRRAGRKA
ncbi:MAG TPA: helix-turn-helix transcriptional regulator [Vicinamibacterales bacterium]|nr:helix-turn-helix transcriptional regulator [Vicinamibacterales bacterium]